jgi:HEAT repeat protein
LVSCRPGNEPMSDGRPLSFWKKEAKQVSFMSFWNSDKDARRHEAFRRLAEIGEPAVPGLMDLMEKNGIPVRGEAFNTLANLGPRAASAVPRLRELLTEDNTELKQKAAWILGTIGPAAAPAVPDLQRLLRQPNSRLRQIAAAALANIGGAGHAQLENALASSDATMRQAAMRGMAARALDLRAREKLIAAGLADPDPHVRKEAVELFTALDRNEAESLAVHLVRGLDDSDPQVNRSAHSVLTMHLQRSSPTPRFLATILQSADAGARADAVWRLGSADHPGMERSRDGFTTKALITAMSDSSPTVRVYAARALAYDGGKAGARGIQALRREVPEVESILGVRAARTLWDVSRRVSDVEEAYEAGLRDPEKWNRVETISAIGAMGKAGEIFVPQLEKLLNDPDGEVRDRAEKILHHIRFKPKPALR